MAEIKKRTRKGTEFFIYTNPDPQELYAELAALPDWDEGIKLISERRFTVKDSDVTYRAINHWSEQGLLDDDREDASQGWRKLSIRDLVWLRLLRELRQFGLPLDKLRVVHSSIFVPGNKKSYWYFDLALRRCLSTMPEAIFLVVFDDGQAAFASQQDLRLTDTLVGCDHAYIRISLNAVLCSMLGTDKYLSPRTLRSPNLSDDEVQIIQSLRHEELKELGVELDGGTIKTIKRTKHVEPNKKISDLIQETKFGTVEISVHDGKAAYTVATKKTKPKK